MLRISGGTRKVTWNEFTRYLERTSTSLIPCSYSRAWNRVSYEDWGINKPHTSRVGSGYLHWLVVVSIDVVRVLGKIPRTGWTLFPQDTQQLPDGQSIAWTNVTHRSCVGESVSHVWCGRIREI